MVCERGQTVSARGGREVEVAREAKQTGDAAIGNTNDGAVARAREGGSPEMAKEIS